MMVAVIAVLAVTPVVSTGVLLLLLLCIRDSSSARCTDCGHDAIRFRKLVLRQAARRRLYFSKSISLTHSAIAQFSRSTFTPTRSCYLRPVTIVG